MSRDRDRAPELQPLDACRLVAVTEPALDTMTVDGIADGATHDEPGPGRIAPVVTHDVDDQEVATTAAAGTDHPPDVTTVGEPMRRG